MKNQEIKIMSVVGARPNFMKVAPIIKAIDAHNQNIQKNKTAHHKKFIRHLLIHTGQHYDSKMSDTFFSDLNLPKPDIFLGAGSGSHAEQTADIMKKFEGVLLQEKPDFLKNGEVAIVKVQPTGGQGLVIEKQADIPQMARFAIRDSGSTVAAGQCIDVVKK